MDSGDRLMPCAHAWHPPRGDYPVTALRRLLREILTLFTDDATTLRPARARVVMVQRPVAKRMVQE